MSLVEPGHTKVFKTGTSGYLAWRSALASLFQNSITNVPCLAIKMSAKLKKSDNNQCLYSMEDRMQDWHLC